MEAYLPKYDNNDPESDRRSMALKLAEDLAPGHLTKSSYEVWLQMAMWKLRQVNAKKLAIDQDLTFQNYLDSNEILDGNWIYEMEMAVTGDVKKVLAEVFAIAKKILLEGNGGAKFVPGTEQSTS